MLTSFKQQPWATSLCLIVALIALTMPEMAAAGSGGDTIARVLCDVVDWFTGSVGKGIATLAIIIIGIGALMGKVSWGMAIIVGIGVAVVFGAESLVEDLGGNSACV